MYLVGWDLFCPCAFEYRIIPTCYYKVSKNMAVMDLMSQYLHIPIVQFSLVLEVSAS